MRRHRTQVTGDAKRKLDAFAAEYHRLKTPRNLVWKSALGSVLLTIQAGTTTAELRVSPAQVRMPPIPLRNPWWFISHTLAADRGATTATWPLKRMHTI